MVNFLLLSSGVVYLVTEKIVPPPDCEKIRVSKLVLGVGNQEEEDV